MCRIPTVLFFSLIRAAKPCRSPLRGTIQNDFCSSDLKPVRVSPCRLRMSRKQRPDSLFVTEHIGHHIDLEQSAICHLQKVFYAFRCRPAVLRCGDPILQIDILHLCHLPHRIHVHSGEYRHQNRCHDLQFFQVAVRRPVCIAPDPSAFWFSGISCNTAGSEQRCISHCHVTGGVKQANRNPIRYLVEHVCRRMCSLPQKIVVVSVRHHRAILTYRMRLQPGSQHIQNIIKTLTL